MPLPSVGRIRGTKSPDEGRALKRSRERRAHRCRVGQWCSETARRKPLACSQRTPTRPRKFAGASGCHPVCLLVSEKAQSKTAHEMLREITPSAQASPIGPRATAKSTWPQDSARRGNGATHIPGATIHAALATSLSVNRANTVVFLADL